MATTAPSGLVSPTSPEGQQNYINPNTPRPGQKVNQIFDNLVFTPVLLAM